MILRLDFARKEWVDVKQDTASGLNDEVILLKPEQRNSF
jgi:hypothetical protein